MNELLKKIYENVIYYETDVLQTGRELDKEIENLINEYADQLDEEGMEIAKTLMYQTALLSEQTGFCLGVKYTVKLLIELLSEK